MQQQPEKKKNIKLAYIFKAGFYLLFLSAMVGMTWRTVIGMVIGFLIAGLGFLCIAVGLFFRAREKKKDVIQDR